MPRDLRHDRPTIGVLAGWQLYRTATNLSYLLPVLAGINRAAQDLGCNLLMGCGMGSSASADDPPRPAWPVPAADVDYVPVGPWNTDGLILFTPLHSPVRTAQVRGMRAAGHPILFIGSGEAGPTIAADNHGGVMEAIGHLAGHGHRGIAFIAGSPDDMAGDTGERLRAYRAALDAHGIGADPRAIAFSNHVFRGGYDAMQQILGSGAAFTAVLASNDESALGAMQALKEAGRTVPGDVAIIGFDNRLEGATEIPSLSSIHVPLFNMGYQALERLLDHVEGMAALPEMTRVPTRLVARASCGCGPRSDGAAAGVSPVLSESRPQRIAAIAGSVMRHARSLEEKECLSLCARLADSFARSIERNDGPVFLATLEEVLQRTMTDDDDAHIWQDAISLIAQDVKAAHPIDGAPAQLISAVLDQARLAVAAHSLRQHRRHVTEQRRVSSRLSLLTTALQTALDEAQIYERLAQHLPGMDVKLAQIVLFDAVGDEPVAWSTARDALAPGQAGVRFPSHAFPPSGLVPADRPYRLVVVPLVDQTGQLGYAVFGTEQLDLYGAIVQQLGGAINTARLYREATEGRRLAEEANRMKSRFLSTISHELRTPLNLIVGLSSMILRASDEGDALLPEAAYQDVQRIHAYSQHLGGLIGDVLDLATSDAGQLRLNQDYIELGPVLRIVADSGRQLASDKGLAWEADLPESGPWIWGDAIRLRQVALNLVSNAVKYTDHGSVSLRLEAAPDSVRVLVTDTGLGIPLEDQGLVFGEFSRSERTVAQGYGGLGLGLAISKRLVEMHGGSIGVRSSGSEGAGSTFFFSLPTVHAPVHQAEPGTMRETEPQHVLVLTNQPASSARLCERLKQRGFVVQVKSAAGAGEPLLAPADPLPAAILLDVSLASDPGWDVLKTIKRGPDARSIPVMFFKSSPEDGSVLELDYLTKPIELAELTRALDQQWLMADADRHVRTILVVDDEPATRDMHARIVRSHASSNHVLKARNGREALRLLEREVVDLVLLDLQMPDMDGFAVLEAMRGKDSLRRIPVIVITGKTLSDADMARLNRGVATVLAKGMFSLEETAAHIEAALARKHKLSSEAQRLVRKAMAYVHEHYADPITRRVIAQHVNITEDHLTYCFRQELGTTPIEYLQRYRINQAKLLLRESGRTITEIALDVGFSESGYFSRVFRRIAGVSPEAFRHA